MKNILNAECRKALKKHPAPATFRDLWDADQERWRVLNTDQPPVNRLRQTALERIMESLSDTFNLPAAAVPEAPGSTGITLPDKTFLETNEITLKKIYNAWLMHRSADTLADRIINIM